MKPKHTIALFLLTFSLTFFSCGNSTKNAVKSSKRLVDKIIKPKTAEQPRVTTKEFEEKLINQIVDNWSDIPNAVSILNEELSQRNERSSEKANFAEKPIWISQIEMMKERQKKLDAQNERQERRYDSINKKRSEEVRKRGAILDLARKK